MLGRFLRGSPSHTRFVNGLWRKYKAKKCDLLTAAITTNATFDLVGQAEENLIAQAPRLFNQKRSYDSIAIIVFYANAFQQGVCPGARLSTNESLRITPFDDFIYLSMAMVLMEFTFLANQPKDCHLPYPTPCPPLRFGYISRPELLGTPDMDRKEQEDLTLSRLVLHRQLWITWKEQGSRLLTPPPSEDEFSESLDKLTKDGVLSVALVFEARVFLDIQEIMGDDVKRGHQDLVQTTTAIDEIMNLRAVDGALDIGGSGERWHERDVDVVTRIKMTSMYWILDTLTNAFAKFKQHMMTIITPDQNKPIGTSRMGLSARHGHPWAVIPETSQSESPRASQAKPPKNPKFTNLSMECHKVPRCRSERS
ncbi:MAG: hypothetical protein Q9208_003620 [Pyrenodesmia sp. 3 TL-2023]